MKHKLLLVIFLSIQILSAHANSSLSFVRSLPFNVFELNNDDLIARAFVIIEVPYDDVLKKNLDPRPVISLEYHDKNSDDACLVEAPITKIKGKKVIATNKRGCKITAVFNDAFDAIVSFSSSENCKNPAFLDTELYCESGSTKLKFKQLEGTTEFPDP